MWDTSCKDWEKRLLAGKSLVPKLPLYKAEADLALTVFKSLRLPDVIGTPTMEVACGDWYFDIVRALFGSYDPKTHVRRIQEFFQLIPKGNAKSSYGGAVMLTAFILNQRPEAEFLFIAPTIEIASIAFKQAKGTIRLDERLDAFCQVQDHIRRITHTETGATLSIKAADTDTITGSKSVGTMIDETHQFARRGNAKEVFIELRGALTKRPDGFLFQTTTQSKQPPTGVFASELEMARKVRDGKVKNASLLPILYELPDALMKNGGWKNRKYWPILNPNLGRSTSAEFLEREVMRAEEEGAMSLALIASQHFNVQIGMSLRSDGWAGAEVWDRGIEPGLTLDAILERSEVVTIGVDGGGLDDLLGVGLIGREKGTKRWLGWAHALISDIGIERRKANAAHYDQFEREGSLTKFNYMKPETLSVAQPLNIAYVVDLVEKVQKMGLLAQVGVDAAGIGGIVDSLADIGVSQDTEKLDAVRQGIALMGAVKTIEIKLADYSFKHGGSALMAWSVGNLKVVPTPTAMRVARDESGYGKIDAAMALFNAAHLMGLNPGRKPEYHLHFA